MSECRLRPGCLCKPAFTMGVRPQTLPVRAPCVCARPCEYMWRAGPKKKQSAPLFCNYARDVKEKKSHGPLEVISTSNPKMSFDMFSVGLEKSHKKI